MSDHVIVTDRKKLGQALRLLALDKGIHRDDIVEELRGRLSPIAKYWKINVGNGAEVARGGLYDNLREYISHIVPLSSGGNILEGDASEKYLNSVKVCFNLVSQRSLTLDADDSRPLPDLYKMPLDARKKWMDQAVGSKNGKSIYCVPRLFRVSYSQSGRNLQSAINQMVDRTFEQVTEEASTIDPVQLADSIEDDEIGAVEDIFVINMTPEHLAQSTGAVTSDTADDPTAESDPPSFAEESKTRFRWKARITKKAAVLLTVAVVVVAGGTIYILRSQPDHKPVSSSPPIIVSVAAIDTRTGLLKAVFPNRGGARERYENSDSGQISFNEVLPRVLKSGGYAVGQIRMKLTLEGNSDRSVSFNDIRPVNIHRQEAIHGATFDTRDGGRGPENLGLMGFNLDSATPVPLNIRSDGSLGAAYFDSHVVTLPGKVKQQIILSFRAQKQAAAFNVRLYYEVGGRNTSMLVRDDKDGKPIELRVTPEQPSLGGK